ncbi:hypothetical protein Bbelb_035020 [Branchiostoma belcheri]|nr:hypothetical protein Bbelb_439480 [Branchiostoma belcheri]KAI8520245.1 hypothetical protein Bbelb_035020 [Branchiostoma belcheri]
MREIEVWERMGKMGARCALYTDRHLIRLQEERGKMCQTTSRNVLQQNKTILDQKPTNDSASRRHLPPARSLFVPLPTTSWGIIGGPLISLNFRARRPHGRGRLNLAAPVGQSEAEIPCNLSQVCGEDTANTVHISRLTFGKNAADPSPSRRDKARLGITPARQHTR